MAFQDSFPGTMLLRDAKYIAVVYLSTASLKRVLAVRIWFSVLASSSCSFRKFCIGFEFRITLYGLTSNRDNDEVHASFVLVGIA
jgi:hypothetical protein